MPAGVAIKPLPRRRSRRRARRRKRARHLTLAVQESTQVKNLSYRLLFSFAVLSITLLFAGLGCGNDDELMCSELDRCVCYGNTDCDYVCEGAEGCAVICNGAPNCDVSCRSPELCQISCEDSANCEVDCGGNECAVACPPSGCTVTNCADPSTCRVLCGENSLPTRSGTTATCR